MGGRSSRRTGARSPRHVGRGSCTSWSVHDTIQLEQHGLPTVVATTTHFVDLTRRVAAGVGVADARVAVFPHPLGGTDDATILAWADAAVDEVISLLTT